LAIFGRWLLVAFITVIISGLVGAGLRALGVHEYIRFAVGFLIGFGGIMAMMDWILGD
jgi:hypothetical protein